MLHAQSIALQLDRPFERFSVILVDRLGHEVWLHPLPRQRTPVHRPHHSHRHRALAPNHSACNLRKEFDGSKACTER